MPNKLSSRMGKRRSLKYKTRDIHQCHGNVLLVDSDRKKSVTRERIMKWIKCLLEHFYVKAGDKTYRQEIGVLMGTSCSPFLANLTLFIFEFE